MRRSGRRHASCRGQADRPRPPILAMPKQASRTFLAAVLLSLLTTGCIHGRYGHRGHRPVDVCEDGEIHRALHVVSAFFHLAAAATE